MEEAWVTLATSDEYAMGALTLAASLKRVQTSKKLVVLISKLLSENVRKTLKDMFDEVITVEEINSGDLANLTLLDRKELGVTFTKIHCWTLIQYGKCVFLDADTLVLANSDELFEREEFSASPDAGWPDCFNSGVFVFVPSLNTFEGLSKLASTTGSFDGGDQGLLNTFFSEWATKDISTHLPFIYNMVASATYSYLPAFKRFEKNIKIVHFIGTNKPWRIHFDGSGEPILGSVEKFTAIYLRLWWQIFSTNVKPALTMNMGSGPNHSPSIHCMMSSANSVYCSPPPPPPKDTRESWEMGKPDFKGTASFSNIMEKMDHTMNKNETKTD